MRTVYAIAILCFKEGLRHRVLYGVFIFGLFSMVFALLISGLFMRDILKIILDICLAAVSLTGLTVPFFLAPAMLSGDLERKTIYTILSRPISRSQYILGKFSGLTLITACIVATMTGGTLLTAYSARYIFADYFFSGYRIEPILVASGFIFLGLEVLTSMAIFWCCITTSSFLATLLVFATYLVGQTVEDMVHFLQTTAGNTISPAIQYTLNGVLYTFPNLAAFNLKQQAAHGIAISSQEISYLAIYGLSYIAIALFCAILLFQRRDLS